jgi:DNA-binding response OmpR family regulator
MSDTATILCIDDEEPGLQLRKRLLESAGYTVLTAHSGREGIQLFGSERIDAAIVDYWMAGMNGMAVARELRRLNPAMPIMMLSAFRSLPDEAIGTTDAWVIKGEVDPEDFLLQLRQLLENRTPR